jgi:DNA-binding response OmpR family regulator
MSRYTILIVEDEPTVLKILKTILADPRSRWLSPLSPQAPLCEVLTAASAEEGLAVAQAFPGPIHLLLADVIMAHARGPDLARQLVSERPQMRVILMSGWPAEEFEVLSLERGWRFLPKPFMPSAVIEAVASELAKFEGELGASGC